MIPAENFERAFTPAEMKSSAEFGARLDKGMMSMVICNARLHQPIRDLGEFQVGLEIELSTNAVWDPNSKIAGAIVQITVVMRFDGSHKVESQRGKELCTIQIAYGVDGVLTQPYDKEEDLREGLRCFSEIGAVLTVWPMLRESMMTVSSKTGLQPLVLPFIRYSTKSVENS